MEISEELEMVYNENMKEMESEEISIEEEETEMQEVVKKILSVSEELESIDSYFEQLSSLQSKVDEELSDLLHFIENPKNRLNNRQSAKLIDYIREKRIERRGLFNDFEIKRVFNDNRNKISLIKINQVDNTLKEIPIDYLNYQIGYLM